MAFKQPRVPEYRENEGTGKYIRSLVLFLKDFCMDVWTANNQRAGEIGAVKAGDVALKASDVGAVPISGGTMTGNLKTTQLGIGYDGNYPKIIFYTSGNEKFGQIQDNADSNYRRFSFAQYHSDQDGESTKYGDSYQLPTASAGLTSNAYYSILTSKDPVKIGQGGTNAKTASAALANLGGVPTSRKVNGKALTADITLDASDVSAVPTSRKVNGKALTADITGGVVGVLQISVTSSAIASDDLGSVSTEFTAISGASKYYAVLLAAGSQYGWITTTKISGTTLTVTYYNASSDTHTIGAKFLIVGIA